MFRRHRDRWLAAATGACFGVILSMVITGPTKNAAASSGDRFQDYIMCTGPVNINPKVPTDGVWMLDYRGGKLLGSVIDRNTGKIGGWAEVDLVAEFGIAPKQDVHFMMTTGTIAQGQSVLYITEVSTGKFGVYSMGPPEAGTGVQIRRHDMTSFRAAAPAKITTVGGSEK